MSRDSSIFLLAVACALWTACGTAPQAESFPSDEGIAVAQSELFNLDDFPRLAGENDDTLRLQRALDTIAGTGRGGTLFIPEEHLVITDTLTYRNASALMIQGEGRDLTVIEQRRFDKGFLSFGCHEPSPGANPDSLCVEANKVGRLMVRDLSLSCKPTPPDDASTHCGTAIRGIWPSMTWDIPVVDIENISIYGTPDEDGGSAWVNGIVLNNPSGSRISDVSIKGDFTRRATLSSAYPYLASDGILMTGNAAHQQVSHYISTTNVSHYNTCYKMNGWLEGISLSQFEAVECGDGVVFIGAGAAPINLYMDNAHINVRNQGIYVDNVDNISVIGIDVYKNGGRSLSDWQASTLATFVNGGFLTIDATRFSTLKAEEGWAAQDKAIVISNMHQGSVTDSSFIGFDRGVDVYSGKNILVQSNRFERTGTPVHLDFLSNRCVVTDNMWQASTSPPGAFVVDNNPFSSSVTSPNHAWSP